MGAVKPSLQRNSNFTDRHCSLRPRRLSVCDHVTDPDGGQVVFYIATSYFDLKSEIFCTQMIHS